MNPKQRRRRYKLHYNLRQRGNRVITRERTVIKRERKLTPIEHKWLNEVIDFGYCVCDDLFK